MRPPEKHLGSSGPAPWVGVGVCVDPEVLPRVAGLADAIGGAIGELRRAAEAGT